jgi:hypothetical protein
MAEEGIHRDEEVRHPVSDVLLRLVSQGRGHLKERQPTERLSGKRSCQ